MADWTRRELLGAGLLGAAAAPVWRRLRPALAAEGGTVLNDVHSRLNPSRVAEVVRPASVEEVVAAVRRAAGRDLGVSVAGGRHAMGGQQFGAGTLHLDTRGLSRVLSFDAETGTIEAEAGIVWPDLIDDYLGRQEGAAASWGIAQKQTGADRLTLGGSLGANAHGRGLTLAPLVGDLEGFDLVDPAGERRRCSREENAELFRLAVGGYGLFGVVTSVRLRLIPRRKLRRQVEVLEADALGRAFEARIAEGYLYGDFQFSTDAGSPDFLRRGVFSCYRPVPAETPVPAEQRSLLEEDWERLLYLAHFDKGRAFQAYADYYLTTSGQVYWSDTHQLSFYADDYHTALDARTGAVRPSSEMITELYVPRSELAEFLGEAAERLRVLGADVIYGTVRLIERDDETFLAWAREPFACTVVNLHVEHSEAGLERARREFRSLIDLALGRRGSFFLTYHRWATREQLETAYPQLPEFLRRKRALDPDERLTSDWYRHMKSLFADRL